MDCFITEHVDSSGLIPKMWGFVIDERAEEEGWCVGGSGTTAVGGVMRRGFLFCVNNCVGGRDCNVVGCC